MRHREPMSPVRLACEKEPAFPHGGTGMLLLKTRKLSSYWYSRTSSTVILRLWRAWELGFTKNEVEGHLVVVLHFFRSGGEREARRTRKT